MKGGVNNKVTGLSPGADCCTWYISPIYPPSHWLEHPGHSAPLRGSQGCRQPSRTPSPVPNSSDTKLLLFSLHLPPTPAFMASAESYLLIHRENRDDRMEFSKGMPFSSPTPTATCLFPAFLVPCTPLPSAQRRTLCCALKGILSFLWPPVAPPFINLSLLSGIIYLFLPSSLSSTINMLKGLLSYTHPH